MSFQFTESQRLAIEERGRSVLVSAAAGSGKTRVLTERLMRYITDPKEPRDIDSFLIITYTRAAAAELRGRILTELGAAIAENPTDRHLRRQQNLCYRAQIGTIHSFCTDVLRENCQQLGLSPAFRVMDDDRAAVMKASVLEQVLDARYEKIETNAAFRLLVDTVGVGRDDTRLAEMILTLYEKLRSHPYPEDWAAEQSKALFLEGVDDVGQSAWGRELLEGLRTGAAYWAARMQEALCEIEAADEKTAKAYGESFAATAGALREFLRALETGWDQAGALADIPFPRLGALRAPQDPELVQRVKALREGCKKAAGSWHSALRGDSAVLIGDMRRMAPAMQELLTLTLEFDRAFLREKRRQNYLDFSDLEHEALRLLVDKGTGGPTQIAEALSHRYTEIMVDEYQDVNAVQDMLFRAVSRKARNLFMVGDVKQSIYRFRLADPGIFLEKYGAYSDGGEAGSGSEGRRILLRENFRSRRCILDACNHVFRLIMSRELGELDYDDAAALKFGAAGFAEADTPAELVVLEPEADDTDEENPAKTELEARYVAGRILEMVERGERVCENGVQRPCSFGDFAVLLQSPGVSGAAYRRALEEAGVRVSSPGGEAYFRAPEVTDVMNMLAVIDNPHLDVALIAVLRAPAFGFTADELAAIRAQRRDGCFYDAMCAARDLPRCGAFLEMLEALRGAAMDLSLEGLLWRIYSQCDLLTIYAALPDGAARRENLMQLFEYAAAFTAGGGCGLYRFVRWLRRLAEKGGGRAAGDSADCVQIMSIHKSKGLEFPFVFLADLSHGFNKSDLHAPVLMHTELGLGPKMTDAGRGIEYPTLARRAIAQRLQREFLSEQMRVLYVAMTRAKEQLVMTCVQKKAQQTLDKLSLTLTRPIAPQQLMDAPNLARWLMLAALSGNEGQLRLTVEPAGGRRRAENIPKACTDTAQAADVRLLSERLAFAYPHAAAVELPTKITATGLQEGDALPPEDGESVPLLPKRCGHTFRHADLDGAAMPDAASRGTVTHAFLQYASLDRLSSEASICAERDRLIQEGRLRAEQAQSVDLDMLLRFGKSELCRRIRRSSQVYREFRFTLLVDAAQYFAVPEGEELLLQGVVDCFIVEDGRITVIDYKTDAVSAAGAETRAAQYTAQLRAYAMAVGRICGMEVGQALLYFLRPGVCVPVPLDDAGE